MIDAGKLRHRIVVERHTETISPAGTPSRTWAEHIKLWACVIPVKAGEREVAERLEHRIEFKVVTRYTDQVKASDRIVYAGRTLEIIAVTDDGERHETLTIECREVQ